MIREEIENQGRKKKARIDEEIPKLEIIKQDQQNYSTIPNDIYNNPFLVELFITRNKSVIELSSELSKLAPTLIHLSFTNSKINNFIEIFKLTNLKVLDLKFSLTNNIIPPEISNLKQLEILSL